MIFSNTKVKSDNTELKIDGEVISEVSKTKCLGVMIDNRSNWKHYINYISCKVAIRIGIIMNLRKVIDNTSLRHLYYAFIYPYMMFCNHVWGNACSVNLNKLVVLEKKVIQIMVSVKPRTPTAYLFDDLNIMKVGDVNVFWLAEWCIKFMLQILKTHFNTCLLQIGISIRMKLDSRNILTFHCTIKNIGKTSIRYRGAVIWNNVLKCGITSCSQITSKQQLKTYVSAGNIKNQLHQPSCAVLPTHEFVLQYGIWLQLSIHWRWLSTAYVAPSLHPLIIFNFHIKSLCIRQGAYKSFRFPAPFAPVKDYMNFMYVCFHQIYSIHIWSVYQHWNEVGHVSVQQLVKGSM